MVQPSFCSMANVGNKICQQFSWEEKVKVMETVDSDEKEVDIGRQFAITLILSTFLKDLVKSEEASVRLP